MILSQKMKIFGIDVKAPKSMVLEAILASIFEVLGGLGGVLRRLGGQDRKRSRGICFLGPSWDRLGGLLGRHGGLLGPS